MVLDWKEYEATAVKAVEEGIVLLENRNGALPLSENSQVAVYGRIQLHYYKSGTGSGGMVNVSKVTDITRGLLESGKVKVNKELLEEYKKWEKENPFDSGTGWGTEPFSQKEMPVSRKLAEKTASVSPTAIVVIGRSAGEDKDNQNIPGAYLLSSGELDLLNTVRKYHKTLIVLLNAGGIMDMKWVKKINPDSLLYVWQGGMIGGTAVANVLTGKATPSGKLADTIARDISDYPSTGNFGSPDRNFYREDIYAGYRYFETFSREKVLYPFGFGLSYTVFDFECTSFETSEAEISIKVLVKNTGLYPGKETVQIYVEKPQGNLGNPALELVDFEKTSTLSPSGEEVLSFSIPVYRITSYDDRPESPQSFSYVLLQGDYVFRAGNSIRNLKPCGKFSVSATKVFKACKQLLAPEIPFKRIKPEIIKDRENLNPDSGNRFYPAEETVPLMLEPEPQRRLKNIPEEIPQNFNDRENLLKLIDVRDKLLKEKNSGKSYSELIKDPEIKKFISQFSDYDLSCIIRGEGMGSPKVTPGTAAAFGGVSKELKALGIPCGCCSDGPSGLRLDSGAKAFSLPSGTLLACTFNKTLVKELFAFTGLEMRANRVDLILGPGMNIHRNPLNGRNFEYFSEDPFLTGQMAKSEILGLKSSGAMGTLKHFCCNNQEFRRNDADSCLSERALREIYLKGFEIAVKEGGAKAIMTTYGPVNGRWTASSYDLNTEILRNEWGFTGFVMTDWWAMVNDYHGEGSRTNFAAMTRAQNDVYMVCRDGATNAPQDNPEGPPQDNTLASLGTEKLTRGELQRAALNITAFLADTEAFRRFTGTKEEVKIINRPKEDEGMDLSNIQYLSVKEKISVNLENYDTSAGKDIFLAFEMEKPGIYNLEITGASIGDETAQTSLSVFSQGIPTGTFTWQGTKGEWSKITKKAFTDSRYVILRLYFPQSGLKLKQLDLCLLNCMDKIENTGDCILLR